FSATWETSSDLPTLAFGTYVVPDSGGSSGYRCATNELIRPDPSGTRYAAPLPLDPSYCPLSMLFSDWDRSGRRDLRVSNDRHYYDNAVGEEQLWRITPGEPPRLYGASDGWQSLQVWGMGIASQDVTGDGLPEVYLTSQGDNKLQTLSSGPPRPAYRDVALTMGVIGTRPATGGDPLPSTAWHPEFEDVNNDGLMDLYVSKGNVDQVPDYAVRDPSDLFLGQPEGRFVNQVEAAGIVNFDRTRGAAVADLNDDGLVDLAEVKLRAPVRLWRNVGAGSADAPAPMGGWLAVRLVQPGANREAIGAFLELRIGEVVTRRELTIGGGHLSGQLGWVHLGLGGATSADVRVTWPDGTVGPWQPVGANQFMTLSPDAAPVPWTPPRP
ncbi:MAG TPA: CRTAC1 family protein, partial [Candidatus Deferrimicrobium sp.]|nr:CRTAC1 family protein [Candidatus Deferrimicrobium sp.]